MRKAVGVGLIIIVIGLFSWFTYKQFTADGSDFSFKESISKLFKKEDAVTIESIASELESNYPSQVREVIEKYNQLLAMRYKDQLKEDQLELYVKATRKLYSNELNELNPMEKQLEGLKSEEKIKLVASQIQDIYIQRNEEDEDIRAEVVMIYATESGSFMRNYNLIKENECWKINSWKDYPISEEKAEQKEG